MRTAAVVLLASVVVATGPATRAEKMRTTRDIRRRVSISGGSTSARHRIYVTNRSKDRLVQTVVLGLYPGLREQPKLHSGPAGWRSRVYEQPNRPDGRAWAVEFTCLPAGDSDSPTKGGEAGAGSSAPATACGIAADETASFDVVLVRRSPTLEVGPVGVVFSDGEAAMAVE
jgi:hypothetical protein